MFTLLKGANRVRSCAMPLATGRFLSVGATAEENIDASNFGKRTLHEMLEDSVVKHGPRPLFGAYAMQPSAPQGPPPSQRRHKGQWQVCLANIQVVRRGRGGCARAAKEYGCD